MSAYGHTSLHTNQGFIDPKNSSTTNLTAATSLTFTGIWFDATDYSQLTCIVNPGTTSGTLYFDVSMDTTIVDTTKPVTVTGTPSVHTLVMVAKYYRIRYTADTDTTVFRLQTLFHKYKSKELTSKLSQAITDQSDVQNVRSVIVAQNTLGTFENVRSDLDNKLLISDGLNALYGESVTVTYSPMIQSSHMYGIAVNSQLYVPFTATGGTIVAGTNGNTALLSTTTSVGSYAVLRSRRVLKYRHGYTNVVRVGGRFTTGVANSLQFMGVGNATSDLYFGYNGANFGIRRSEGGLLHVHSFQITAASTATENATITLNGVAFTVGLTNAGGDANFTAHQVEIGGTAPVTYTGWNTEHIGNTILFIADSVGVRNGTYSFSSGTATATVSLIKSGTPLTTITVDQADWNGRSSMITRLDPTKFNLYEIVYSWFGIANVRFNVYNSDLSRFETVHTLKFSNGDDLSLSSANMYVQLGAASLGSTSVLSTESTGHYGGTFGTIEYQKQPKSSASSAKTVTTEQVILSISNRKTINGYSNQSEIFLDELTIATDGTKSVIIRVILNPTTLSANSTTDYTDSILFSEDDLLIYDTQTDTYTGGTIVKQTVIPKDGGITLNFTNKELFLTKDDVLIITAESTVANIVNVSASFISDI